MLIEDLTALATDIGEGFDDFGTEFIEILRAADASNDWGGVGADTAASAYGELPAVLLMKPSGTAQRWVLGQENFDARILIPAEHQGAVIDVRPTDRIRVLAREGANPERFYAVREPLNKFGVYFDVGVTKE